ncbi:YaeQ family protein [Vibrio sp.]|uniref:YaeQ family protein n=1 Tax=Vibrio sp. TaxID=678 RepID=UPI003D0A3FE0
MALKPTIYKFRIALTNLNSDYYDTLNLTVAQHPSETGIRMLARILAYALNADQKPSFTKGLSTTDEPDLWSLDLTGKPTLWIDIGEPSFDRIKKAARLATQSKVYCFNSKANQWWQQIQNKLTGLNTEITYLGCDSLLELSESLPRTIDMSIMISGDTLYLDTNDANYEVVIEQWRG